MNDLIAERDARICAYLNNLLDPQALEQFELELFAQPELLEAVETERLLRQGFRDIDADLAKRVVALRPRAPTLVQRLLPLAATFLLGAVLPGLLLLQGTGAPDSGIGNAQVLRVEQKRGASNAPLLRLTPEASRVVLQFPLLAEPGVTDFTLEITGTGTAPWQLAALRPGSDGLISVDIPAAQLRPGSYEVRIVGRRADGSQAEYLKQQFELAR